MQPFTFNTTPSIVFGAGASKRAGPVLGKVLGERILFVTDPGIRRLGLCDGALKSFAETGVEVVIFDQVEADPSLATLMAAVEMGLSSKVTGVFSLGGGSSLDVAKLAALLIGSGENLDEAWGVAQAKGPRLPLALAPTTAGTGSEVTPVSIITVGAEEKRGVSSPVILPDVALLDPELTLGLPPHITAATGIDAMVHAIEAYTSKNANNNPLSKMQAREALRLIGANIEKAVFDGADIEARGAMLQGAMLTLAKLDGARMSKAKLSGAFLPGASAVKVRAAEADFTGAYMPDTDLRQGVFTNAKFDRADLGGRGLGHPGPNGARLQGADFTGASFVEANLTNVRMTETLLSGADFSGARLGSADMSWSHAGGAKLERADLSWTRGYGTDFSGAKFNGARLVLTQLTGAKMTGADFSESLLDRVDMTQTVLSGAKAKGAKVTAVNLKASRGAPAELKGER